jgi:nickel-dependent lactate racemase
MRKNVVEGVGSMNHFLSTEQVFNICIQAFENKSVQGKKLLFIIPDHTRTAPMDVMFRALYELLANRVALFDVLIALGTHPPMSDKMINDRVGITEEERANRYAKARFFNHSWDDPRQLAPIGAISAEEVEQLTHGLMKKRVDVSINKMVLDYDLLVIVGPTFPHEVIGFSGGNKYLFPGIAGREIIDMFHWLGALLTSPKIIGTKHTPVRDIVDRAAAMVPVERTCLSLVVAGDDLVGLYAGAPEEAWSAAADLSEKLHIIYKEKPYKSILSRAPEMYDDLWTGAKCMYKMECVVADGGELIIYAPHIKEISVTHGKKIAQVGYHVKDYFLRQSARFAHVPGSVMAHSTHVKGIGTFTNGIEKPRIHVILATQISEEMCRKINLGYRHPDTIQPEEWMNREEEGFLYVPKAGEMLYRLKNDPFRHK